MPISSKPRHGDPVTDVRKNRFGTAGGIPTPQFQEFLDELEEGFDRLEDRVTYLEGLTVVTAIDHTVVNTVTGIQTIICTDDLTVSLIATPNDRDKVIVVSQGFEIVIDGNGKKVNAETTVTLRVGFEIGLQMEYSAELDEWFRI